MLASEMTGVLSKARQGDADAFRQLVERHSHRAFRLAFRMTGHEQDAEDVVQESFLKAYTHLASFRQRADFGTWLHRIVANCALDALRRREARPTQPLALAADDHSIHYASDEPGPDRLAVSAELRERLTFALAQLSAMERAAFVLRHYEGQSIDEIGETLGLGNGPTKQAIFRAVRKVRATLRDQQ